MKFGKKILIKKSVKQTHEELGVCFQINEENIYTMKCVEKLLHVSLEEFMKNA